MTDEQRKAEGIEALPSNLWDATQITEQSDLVHKAMGEHAFRSFIENKKIEWDQ